jgi:hypothetical protein
MCSEEAGSDQISASPVEPLSAFSSQAEDPLADARCLHCGYPLRGLPENRCPECGTPFDPERIANSFVPQWPRLMMWYLMACVARSLLDLPQILEIVSSRVNPTMISTRVDHLVTDTARVLETTLTLSLGSLAVWGLYRRRDWARKVCITIFVIVCLLTLTRLGPVPRRVAGGPMLKDLMGMLLQAVAILSSCVLPILLGRFLVTGLRPYSLTRSYDIRPPRLQPQSFDQKHDWLLLAVLVLVGVGAARTCCGVDLLLLYRLPRWHLTVGTWDLAFKALSDTIPIATGVCALAAAVRIWRKPETLRTMVTAVTVLAMAYLPLGIVAAIAYQVGRSGLPDSKFLRIIASSLMDTVAINLVPLTLFLFAFLGVSRDDIRRLAWTRRQ